ncbi:MAG: hypothetical protein ABIE47_06650 [Pseudomonadota bacterium]
MSKINWNKTFQLDENTEIECGWQNTRYGFRHLAVVKTGWREVAKAKACYYNRTWESYTYQSVLHAAIRKAFPKSEAEFFCAKVDGKGAADVKSSLGMIAGIAKLGEILCDKPEDKNSWKMRMLKAGMGEGLQPPDDWDQLPEKEKQRRLDGAIASLSA